MSDEQGYTLKEVIENNFKELKSDMKDGFKEIKNDLKDNKTTADNASIEAKRANSRIDNYDRWFRAFFLPIIGLIIKAIWDLFFSKGG